MKQRYVDQFSQAALSELLAAYRGMTLTILLADQDEAQVPALQQLCTHFDITLEGAIFPQLIGRQGTLPRGAWLLPRPQPYHSTLVALPPGAPAEQIAAEMAATVESMLAAWSDSTPPTLFLTFDYMIPNIASALEALYLRLANRVSYAGINAGSGRFISAPCLFDNHRHLANGVLCALRPSGHFPALEHGYRLSTQPMLATSSENNKIVFIDWQPAFGKYQELIKTHFQHDMQREELYHFGVDMPFGLIRANGDLLVRMPVALTPEDAMLCAGEVPEHSILTLLKAPESTSEHALVLAERLRHQQALTPDHLLEIYYCVGRQMHFGDRCSEELATLLQASGAGDLAGALSLGEIGSLRDGDYPQFHNGAILGNGQRL